MLNLNSGAIISNYSSLSPTFFDRHNWVSGPTVSLHYFMHAATGRPALAQTPKKKPLTTKKKKQKDR